MTRFLRSNEVAQRTGLSRWTIRRLEAKGDFPKRRRLTATLVAWDETEVSSWLKARPAVTSTLPKSA